MIRDLNIYISFNFIFHVKVLKEVSRKYKDKTYYKYKINISSKILELAGIGEGDGLTVKTEEGRLILEKVVK